MWGGHHEKKTFMCCGRLKIITEMIKDHTPSSCTVSLRQRGATLWGVQGRFSCVQKGAFTLTPANEYRAEHTRARARSHARTSGRSTSCRPPPPCTPRSLKRNRHETVSHTEVMERRSGCDVQGRGDTVAAVNRGGP